MNASGSYTLEDILEWVVIGLLVAVATLAGLWLVGWVMVFLGKVFLAVAALIVVLLKFLVPALVIAGLLFLILRALSKPQTAA
ncbi:hypothetical protein [Oceanithermus sp.]|uniref:hypothetical protein n=1 Tax=Oceanithermus sp. TaxID=2268145 RepID=UPI0025E2D9F8|nr:hypothetical protein [Oceanithermus sp.]